MEHIKLSAELKRQVENVNCPRCEAEKLTFQRVEYDEGFIFKHGGSVVVDTNCNKCKDETAVIVQIPAS